jgi:hypothetical protein
MTDELERIWKEAVVVEFKAMPRNSFEGPRKATKTLS